MKLWCRSDSLAVRQAPLPNGVETVDACTGFDTQTGHLIRSAACNFARANRDLPRGDHMPRSTSSLSSLRFGLPTQAYLYGAIKITNQLMKHESA